MNLINLYFETNKLYEKKEEADEKLETSCKRSVDIFKFLTEGSFLPTASYVGLTLKKGIVNILCIFPNWYLAGDGDYVDSEMLAFEKKFNFKKTPDKNMDSFWGTTKYLISNSVDDANEFLNSRYKEIKWLPDADLLFKFANKEDFASHLNEGEIIIAPLATNEFFDELSDFENNDFFLEICNHIFSTINKEEKIEIKDIKLKPYLYVNGSMKYKFNELEIADIISFIFNCDISDLNECRVIYYQILDYLNKDF